MAGEITVVEVSSIPTKASAAESRLRRKRRR
jgi:hypothetical protein